MNLKKFPTFLIRISLSLTEFIIFVDFWIAIVVLLWGSFNYRLISVGDTYFEAGNIYRLIIIFIISSGIWRLLKFLYPNRSFGNIFKNTFYYLIGIIIVHFAITIPVYLQPYYSFNYFCAADFAFQNHAIYNTLKGDILKSGIFPYCQTAFRDWNFLIEHFSPIILCLVPIYYFFQNGAVLIICQSIAIGISIIPIFLIAHEKIKNKISAVIVSLSFLVYPLVVRFPFCEFRQEYIAIPILLFTFYAVMKNKVLVAIILLGVAVMCKEELFIATAGIGIYIFLSQRHIDRRRLVGIIIVIMSIIGSAFYIFIVRPFLMRGIVEEPISHYALDCLKSKILKIISDPKSALLLLNSGKKDFIVKMFKYLGFLPLFSSTILLIVPFLLTSLIMDAEWTCFYIWHNALIVPFLFVSLIFAIHNITRIFKNMHFLIIIWLACFSFYYGGSQYYSVILKQFFDSKLYIDLIPDIYKEFCKAETFIPKESSVFTHYFLLPNLSNREKIYSQMTCPYAERVNMDYILFCPLRITEGDKKFLDDIKSSGRYECLFNSNNFIVMARGDLVSKSSYLVSDFAQDVDYDKWDVNVCNVKYKSLNGGGYRLVSVYFDGDGNEDEFIQMRRGGLDIDLKEYQYFTIGYNLEDSDVQTIEVVFGVDFDGDYRADIYIKRFIPELQLEQDLWRNLFNIISEEFPDRLCYKVIQLELYPHKVYNVDCSEAKEGWYKFWLGKVSFFNVLPK